MADEPRPEGFYWVRLPEYGGRDVEIARWYSSGAWFIAGNELEYQDGEIEVLSPRLEPPA